MRWVCVGGGDECKDLIGCEEAYGCFRLGIVFGHDVGVWEEDGLVEDEDCLSVVDLLLESDLGGWN